MRPFRGIALGSALKRSARFSCAVFSVLVYFSTPVYFLKIIKIRFTEESRETKRLLQFKC